MQEFRKDLLPDGDDWLMCQRTVTTKAKRIDGPFQVLTAKGMATCLDGWLLIDEDGFPYGVPDATFRDAYDVGALGILEEEEITEPEDIDDPEPDTPEA